MMRWWPTVFLLLIAGCSRSSDTPDAIRAIDMKQVTVNGVVITFDDQTETVNSYHGQWKDATYAVLVARREIRMNGILQSVRVNWPERDYYTVKPRSWPANSSVRGVLRGPKTGGTHAQFQLKSDAGIVFIEFFAESNVLDEQYFRSFFDRTVLTCESYSFPDDGDGHVEIAPLYPPPEELP